MTQRGKPCFLLKQTRKKLGLYGTLQQTKIHVNLELRTLC